ncbi:hypothetical protein SODALDRAFT_330915 [Sodiomyces alkalinus F11]|uniref:Uncharacterized protein n=1 Tax=Sodiomyces alkalinus (strain CBS 110278 / VKM F-3762 / F11) TaxID=1314773 RepID=A0A3N2Q375_SODAK|nr:hypothetical protein SODALDRAFT_330915 [Sodiomyces alkalinus F11]ROT41200.1 hypothetical protein SODALDRAFT_330915 [Sodiomyces alkalinus F11]
MTSMAKAEASPCCVVLFVLLPEKSMRPSGRLRRSVARSRVMPNSYHTSVHIPFTFYFPRFAALTFKKTKGGLCFFFLQLLLLSQPPGPSGPSGRSGSPGTLCSMTSLPT